MNVSQWDHYELSYQRVVLFAVGCASLLGFTVFLATREALGNISAAFSVLASIAFCYLILTEPRRSIDRTAVNQSRESLVLAAAATIHLQTTRSRNRTLLMLDTEERELSAMLSEVRRMTLLGIEPRAALSKLTSRVPSLSVRRILGYVSDRTEGVIEDEGSEFENAFRHAQTTEETKTPIFIALSFFAPIMLVLFAGMAHATAPVALIGLCFLEVVVLNLVFSTSSPDRSITR